MGSFLNCGPFYRVLLNGCRTNFGGLKVKGTLVTLEN